MDFRRSDGKPWTPKRVAQMVLALVLGAAGGLAMVWLFGTSLGARLAVRAVIAVVALGYLAYRLRRRS